MSRLVPGNPNATPTHYATLTSTWTPTPLGPSANCVIFNSIGPSVRSCLCFILHSLVCYLRSHLSNFLQSLCSDPRSDFITFRHSFGLGLSLNLSFFPTSIAICIHPKLESIFVVAFSTFLDPCLSTFVNTIITACPTTTRLTTIGLSMYCSPSRFIYTIATVFLKHNRGQNHIRLHLSSHATIPFAQFHLQPHAISTIRCLLSSLLKTMIRIQL